MRSYRFAFVVFCMFALSSYGCVAPDFKSFFSKKPQPVSSSIESEDLSPPVSEEELDQDNISSPVKDNAAIRMEIIGSWKTSHQGIACNLTLTLTRLKKDFRGTARGCYGKLALLSSWNIVNKNSFELKNKGGKTIIVFRKIGEQSFEGSFDGESEIVSIYR
ncbi:membrane protein [Candidatus Liberibacter solanacearum]|uniref:Alkaline proteinase inhibitor/ Outer membrane lipoprotein Omp19 domain-containing protein n=1 Tax=Candidatus Liberibacter solanacearum TaxID=556287 RepID=A0A094Z2V5_9HYPH|nr:AprI/Inh family metalloprotease inhibitor [Candidatus Liberibacter solanacearum]KGB27244.1 membrane protein [Candidatus Liberibacter solanacearum]KJZ81425.1 membrane protein [Candidatus Liberibacter solanacearum]KJZ82554.1 hypothetical protein DJ66_0162 [Candidatus Liberibacter solanacearum]KQC49059.1 hypothetical protein AP064_03085 [Candidatus Liberibacter solanacearum]